MAEADEVANLAQQVAANRDAVQDARTVIDGLTQTVADLNTELQNAIAAGGSNVPPQIKAVADRLATAIPRLAQAIGTKAT